MLAAKAITNMLHTFRRESGMLKVRKGERVKCWIFFLQINYLPLYTCRATTIKIIVYYGFPWYSSASFYFHFTILLPANHFWFMVDMNDPAENCCLISNCSTSAKICYLISWRWWWGWGCCLLLMASRSCVCHINFSIFQDDITFISCNTSGCEMKRNEAKGYRYYFVVALYLLVSPRLLPSFLMKFILVVLVRTYYCYNYHYHYNIMVDFRLVYMFPTTFMTKRYMYVYCSWLLSFALVRVHLVTHDHHHPKKGLQFLVLSVFFLYFCILVWRTSQWRSFGIVIPSDDK